MTRCKRLACLLLAILMLLPGVACGKRAADSGKVMPVPETRGETGWPVYEVKAEGFAIELPPDWRQVDMDPKTYEAKLNEVLNQNPELAPVIGNVRQQIAAGVKFFGFDPTAVQTGFATNVNVLRIPFPPGSNLDTVVAAALQEMERLPGLAKPIAHERLKSPYGERERLRYKVSVNIPNGQRQIATTQFLLVMGAYSYAVTLTTLPDQEAKYTSTFDRIGQSFRFIK